MNPYSDKAYAMFVEMLKKDEELEPREHKLSFQDWVENKISRTIDPVTNTRALNDSYKYENLETFGYMERSTYKEIVREQTACHKCMVDQNFESLKRIIDKQLKESLTPAALTDFLEIKRKQWQNFIDKHRAIYNEIITWNHRGVKPGINFITTEQYERYKQSAYIEGLFYAERYHVLNGYLVKESGIKDTWKEEMVYAQVEVAILITGYIQGLIEGSHIDTPNPSTPKISSRAFAMVSVFKNSHLTKNKAKELCKDPKFWGYYEHLIKNFSPEDYTDGKSKTAHLRQLEESIKHLENIGENTPLENANQQYELDLKKYQ